MIIAYIICDWITTVHDNGDVSRAPALRHEYPIAQWDEITGNPEDGPKIIDEVAIRVVCDQHVLAAIADDPAYLVLMTDDYVDDGDFAGGIRMRSITPKPVPPNGTARRQSPTALFDHAPTVQKARADLQAKGVSAMMIEHLLGGAEPLTAQQVLQRRIQFQRSLPKAAT